MKEMKKMLALNNKWERRQGSQKINITLKP